MTTEPADTPAPAMTPAGTATFLFTDIEGSTSLEERIGTARYARCPRAAPGDPARGGRRPRRRRAGHRGRLVLRRLRRAPARRWRRPSRRSARSSRSRGPRTPGSRSGWASTRARRARRAAASSASTSTGRRGSRPPATAGRSSPRTRPGRSSRARCPPGVTLRELGEYRLRDLLAPERLFQVEGDGLPSEFPKLRTPDTRPNNLPTQLTTFVGRDDELAEARRAVRDDPAADDDRARRHREDAALAPAGDDRGGRASPTGSSSCRWSRSATRCSSRRGSRRRVGITETGSKPIAESLDEWLAQPARAAGPRQLRAGRRRRAGHRRPAPRRAGPEGDRHQPGRAPRLGRAGVPGPGAADAARPVAACPDASGCSCRAARAASTRPRSASTRRSACSSSAPSPSGPAFAVTNENAPAVAAIAARLHGMPLAIELAAARIKLLSPDAILGRLEHQLDVLSAGGARPARAAADAARRHRLELRPARRRQPPAPRPAVGVRRASGHRGGGGGHGPGVRAGHRRRRRPRWRSPTRAWSASTRAPTASRASRCSSRSASTPASGSRRAASGRRSSPAIATGSSRWPSARRRSSPGTTSGAGSTGSSSPTTTSARSSTGPSPSRTRRSRSGSRFTMWRFWQKHGHLGEARRRLEAMEAAAVVARRPATSGAPARGARRRLLVAGRPRRDARSTTRRPSAIWAGHRRRPRAGERLLQRVVLVRARPGRDVRHRRPRWQGRGVHRARPSRPSGRSATSAARPTPCGASGPCTTSRPTSASGEPEFRQALELFRDGGRPDDGELGAPHARARALIRQRQTERGEGCRRAMRSAISTRRATSPGSR